MADKNPTRVRVLADGETKEWSVLQPEGMRHHPQRPMRWFVRAEPNGLIFVEEAEVTSANDNAERLVGGYSAGASFRRDDVRWLLDVLPTALDHANWHDPAVSSRSLREDRHPASVVTLARQLVRELRTAKQITGSNEAVSMGVKVWTQQECALLSQLCDVLGVDRHDGGLER